MQKPFLKTVFSLVAVLVACFFLLPAAAQKASYPKPQDNLTIAEPLVRELLPLMTTDPRGKLSKQDYLRFMETEFNRLDTDKSGQLDVATLTRNAPRSVAFVGK